MVVAVEHMEQLVAVDLRREHLALKLDLIHLVQEEQTVVVAVEETMQEDLE